MGYKMNHNIRFFECEISDGEDAMSICIKAIREPTLEEATTFLARDIANNFGSGKVTSVDELTEKEARAFYCFDGEDKWPIFGA